MDTMIDIETLSTQQDALVLSIAALRFELFEEHPVFHESIVLIPNMIEQITFGRHVEQATQDFWAKQPPEVSDHWRRGQDPATPVWETMTHFHAFMLLQSGDVWAHGICFDITILENLMLKTLPGKRVPWKYNKVSDVRTISRHCLARRTPDADQSLEIVGYNAHHPLDDCKRQVWDLWSKWPGPLRLATKVEAA